MNTLKRRKKIMAELSKFKVARVRAEVLGEMYDDIQYKLKNVEVHYGRTGNMIEATKWNSDTQEYEKVFDEEGNVVMKEEWADIPYTDEELENMPEIQAKKVVYKELLKEFEKML